MNKTARDFSGALPPHLAAAGQPARVPSMPGGSSAPDLTLKEQNAITMQRFRELQTARPRPTITTPQPRPVVPTAEESAAALAIAREHLREAIGRRDAAQRMVADAESALARGKAAADAVHEHLRDLGDVDRMVGLWRADRLKRGKDTSAAPDDLRRRRDEHARLTQEVDDADRAVAVLMADHEAARTRLADTRQHVEACARGVLGIHARALAAQMTDHQRVAFRIKRKLVALLDTDVLGHAYERPAGITETVHADPEYWGNISPKEKPTMMQAWRALAESLQVDPDADLGGTS